MRLVFAGTPDVAVPALDALMESEHEVVAVITRPDAPQGRGKKVRRSPVAERAIQLGLELLQPDRPKDDKFAARLLDIAPDCCPIVAYGALIPQAVLDIPAHGWINLHFSLLPRWRGAAPVQRAVLAGDVVTGAVTFELVAELDAGDLYSTIEEPIMALDTSGDLLERLSWRGAELLVQTLDDIAAGASPTPQPEHGSTHAAKLTAADGRIGWHHHAELIDRQIRACTPAPGAWTYFRGERFKLGPAQRCATDDPLAPEQPLRPGRLLVTKKAVLVGTGRGPMRLGNVQAFGKKPMPAPDWARGVTLESDEGFDDQDPVEDSPANGSSANDQDSSRG